MNLLVILIVIVSLLLMLVILAQNSKGGGLSSQFGGSGASQMMGVKRTGDLLEKITWGLGISLIALSLSTVFFMNRNQPGRSLSPNVQRAQEQVVPGLGGSQLEEGAVDGVPAQENEQEINTGVNPSDDTSETDLD